MLFCFVCLKLCTVLRENVYLSKWLERNQTVQKYSINIKGKGSTIGEVKRQRKSPRLKSAF